MDIPLSLIYDLKGNYNKTINRTVLNIDSTLLNLHDRQTVKTVWIWQDYQRCPGCHSTRYTRLHLNTHQ